MTEDDIEKLESEYFRSYCDLRQYSHYNENTRDEISFALQSPGGGVEAEMIMRWIDLGEGYGTSPQLTVFNESMHVLICFRDVLHELAERKDENYTPEEFIEILEECGFMSTDSFKGDYIPDDMFKDYQSKRKIIKRNRTLNTLLK